jgi:N-acetylglucosamine malate deacetylase 1
MNILVVSPHPDDETLGCGGTILRHKKNGDKVYWLNITDISLETGWDEKKVNKRKSEIDSVIKRYKFSKFFNLSIPTTKVDTFPISDIIQKITNIYKKVFPEIIYIPYANDIHSDHQIISKAMQSTFKWFRYSHINKVLMYETISETEFNFLKLKTFNPNVFVNISDFIDDKIETMKVYESEIEAFPFPRSEKNIRALAAFRGSQSGYIAAEAFELVFERNK